MLYMSVPYLSSSTPCFTYLCRISPKLVPVVSTPTSLLLEVRGVGCFAHQRTTLLQHRAVAVSLSRPSICNHCTLAAVAESRYDVIHSLNSSPSYSSRHFEIQKLALLYSHVHTCPIRTPRALGEGERNVSSSFVAERLHYSERST